MGSSAPPKTIEELATIRSQNDAKAQELQQNQMNSGMTVVGGQASNLNIGDQVNMSDDGRSFYTPDGGNRGQYKFNPITGKYHNHGGDIVDLGRAPQQQQEGAGGASAGGGSQAMEAVGQQAQVEQDVAPMSTGKRAGQDWRDGAGTPAIGNTQQALGTMPDVQIPEDMEGLMSQGMGATYRPRGLL
jgi:hypothetical protein